MPCDDNVTEKCFQASLVAIHYENSTPILCDYLHRKGQVCYAHSQVSANTLMWKVISLHLLAFLGVDELNFTGNNITWRRYKKIVTFITLLNIYMKYLIVFYAFLIIV